MTTIRRKNDSSEALNRLAQGVNCPQCGAWTDTQCKTASSKPHLRRVDKAVALHLKGKGAGK